MKKWFFSHKGNVTGPLKESEANDFLTKNPESYGWHPSFSQWKPVHLIKEFSDLVPMPVSAAQIPNELITAFNDQKSSLSSTIGSLDDNIKFTKTYLYELEQEINIYKRLTLNLSDEVKSNIGSIEQKYDVLLKSFEDIIEASKIAKTEFNEVVTDFDQRVAKKVSENTSSTDVVQKNEHKTDVKSEAKVEIKPEQKTESKAEVSVTESKIEPKTTLQSETKVHADNVAEIRPNMKLVEEIPTGAASIFDSIPERPRTAVSSLDAVATPMKKLNPEQAADIASGISSVKNMFKSVLSPKGSSESAITNISEVEVKSTSESDSIDNDGEYEVEYDEHGEVIVDDREARIRRRSRRRR